MIDTKYNIGDTVYLPWKVTRIMITECATKYRLESKIAGQVLIINEETIPNAECISTDAYEAEINALKDAISELKEKYQQEHLKALKLKCDAVQGDSHHPHSNTYSDDWRRP